MGLLTPAIPAFDPLFRNPHVMTVLANFWPRQYDHARFPMESRLIQTEPDTQVLVQTQRPSGGPIGHVVLLHGLEGSGEAGYIISMAWATLSAGFVTHRFHMRTCGGTAHLAKTLYHGGLTSDLRTFLESERLSAQAEGSVVRDKSSAQAEGSVVRESETDLPVFLIGFSLGGNIALKLAGELGETNLIHGVCAISTPIDLAAGVRRIGDVENRIYERRFLRRMRSRLLATGRYTRKQLDARTIYEIDDKVTAPSFGFQGADHYYATQSSQNFLDRIRVPTVLIQSKDDTYIPFEIFQHPAIAANPFVRLIATENGGHLGFLNRRRPRFWLDQAAVAFLQELVHEAVSSAQTADINGTS